MIVQSEVVLRNTFLFKSLTKEHLKTKIITYLFLIKDYKTV
jgi:hypothetical protein